MRSLSSLSRRKLGSAEFSLLSLYRQILRAHQHHLPATHRELGNTYVRTEFRLHQGAKPDFLQQFERHWRDYLKVISKPPKPDDSGTVFGRDMTTQEIDALSDDQRVKLLEIREKAAKGE